ncbi:MAG: D-amino-acid transaminase [Alphaproteobacteria bacterium]|jgi:D-alanine transaminase|nr:D-amino-acid transaminase [Alphaproteobacteria bacterium]MBT5390456.1 D-amino-acid transaminase [Alphaproteobacteria bacterium]MBT5540477.1 D-amino-acid transaminase [Alphaproteobacteria bacterium]MBT5655180.1 D-amino-acid transaminase [Alphaproteobacteria bacterium]
MSRCVYVNGRYVPHNEATIHVFDRGFQFSDGVYEVMAVVGGKIISEQEHLDRLAYSLKELEIPAPCKVASLKHIFREVLKRNKIRDGRLYLQVTRGIAPRDHAYAGDMSPSIIVASQRVSHEKEVAGIKVITIPDARWKRTDIKSISLLANVMAKREAAQQEAGEAWLTDDNGYIREAAVSNVWIVLKDGRILTPPLSSGILKGTTRSVVLDLIKELGLKVEEKLFTVEEAENAEEAFISGSSQFVRSVVQINERVIGTGEGGPITHQLREAYFKWMEAI